MCCQRVLLVQSPCVQPRLTACKTLVPSFAYSRCYYSQLLKPVSGSKATLVGVAVAVYHASDARTRRGDGRGVRVRRGGSTREWMQKRQCRNDATTLRGADGDLRRGVDTYGVVDVCV